MTLLGGLFSKKNKSSSKVSAVAYSNSVVSLDDDEYVSVVAHSVVSHDAQPSASSSKLALPFRRKRDPKPLSDQARLNYADPLLEPPPRRSSLFQSYQDDYNVQLSTRSLPSDAEHRTPQIPGASKKSMFSWKERGNLKSFRHVRPDSPGLPSPAARSPSPAPVLAPIPTTTFPSPPVSFQVTSRRPRGNSFSDLTTPGSSPQTASQQKMAAGAFRQAARRSATSLSLTDSPMLSPVRTSLDDRPPLSLLSPSQSASDQPPSARSSQTPPQSASDKPPSPRSSQTPAQSASDKPPGPRRSQTPSISDTPKLTTSITTSPISSTFSSSGPMSLRPPSPKPTSVTKPTSVAKPPRTRTNAFADSSSSSSSSEDEDEDEESTSDAGVGAPRISRRRTITQNQSQNQAGTLPPLSSSVRQQILRATPPAISSSMFEGSSTATSKDVPRPQSSTGVYGPGTRPRASLSVGALTPSAKETRASIAHAANARLAHSEHFISSRYDNDLISHPI
ncbi:hypothetical protein JB92DRAFT_1617742 [Gautieria morchelliformis]|nr:hypothetical protein JB92DRAFT_1617742 [Gautieria morchelliformis]